MKATHLKQGEDAELACCDHLRSQGLKLVDSNFHCRYGEIDIIMLEKEDGSMVFEPAALNMKKGETVRFLLTNKGDSDHEFVMDDVVANQKHKLAMEKYPDMEHADPNAIRLESGESGEIVWTFANTGKFEFACLIPGHYEAGMHGALTVEDRTAAN